MTKAEIEKKFGGTGVLVATALGITPRTWYGYRDPLPQRVINQVYGVLSRRKAKA